MKEKEVFLLANLVLKNNTSGGKTSVTADNFVGNASTASKWLTARTLTLAGDASGSVSIDGSGNMTLSVAIANDSHTHAWGNITGKPSTFPPSSHTHDYLSHKKLTAVTDFNTLTTTAWNSIANTGTNSPTTSNHGVVLSAFDVGTPFQIWYPDNSMAVYKRWCSNGTWSSWSNTWAINITGNAATASSASSASSATSAAYLSPARTLSGSNHAEALKAEFTNYKSSITRNRLISYYSSAYGNGSYYMGYFLSGYDTNPYGGFFVAHYNDAYYVGVMNGSFNQHLLLTSSNYSGYALPRSGGAMSGTITLAATGLRTNHASGYYTDAYGNFYHSNTESGSYWNIFNSAGTMSLKYYYETGLLVAPAVVTANHGTSAPGSGTRGYGTVGAIYYKV